MIWLSFTYFRRKGDEPSKTSPKADIHQKKVLLSVWWDFKGVLFFELLPRNETIDLNVYCRQLENLNQSIAQKRPELVNRKRVVFYHDNARPHTSLMTRQKLLELGWASFRIPHILQTKHHLFRYCQNSLPEITFIS